MKSNIIDQFFIDLANGLDGWGMLIYVLVAALISAILSALIGLERYRKGENAGMRTHALLAVGCSFLMSISLWAIPMAAFDAAKFDISRIAAATVSGVGFLGAGVIIKDKFTVKGLSTATTLWICAAIPVFWRARTLSWTQVQGLLSAVAFPVVGQGILPFP